MSDRSEVGLIQTFGGQPMPALIGAVAFGAKEVVLVHQSGSREVEAAARALQDHDRSIIQIGVDPSALLSQTFEHVKNEVSRMIESGMSVIVNATGGSAAMIMGAVRAAMDNEKWLSNRRIQIVALELPHGDEDGFPQLSQMFPAHDRSFDMDEQIKQRLTEKINVKLVVMAHGQQVSSKQLDERLVSFARTCLQAPEAEEEVWSSLHQRLMNEGSPSPERKEWRQGFKMREDLGCKAVEAGLVVRLEESGRFAISAGRESAQCKATFERNAKLLLGGWVEAALLTYAKRQGLRDICWSSSDKIGQTEHDLLALKGTTLVVGSAKRSSKGERLFAHLHEIRAHANRLGGRKSLALMAVARMSSPYHTDASRVGELVGVDVIGGRELLDACKASAAL